MIKLVVVNFISTNEWCIFKCIYGGGLGGGELLTFALMQILKQVHQIGCGND